jgi:hypothetical protein
MSLTRRRGSGATPANPPRQGRRIVGTSYWPVTFNSVPDFEDYPAGCFLLAASEVWKLASP